MILDNLSRALGTQNWLAAARVSEGPFRALPDRNRSNPGANTKRNRNARGAMILSNPSCAVREQNDCAMALVCQVRNRLRPTPGEVDGITYDFNALDNDDAFINALGHALRNSHINHLCLTQMVDMEPGGAAG